MSKYYFELTLKPDNNNYELFLDLLTSITEDAIEELDGTLIVRSEEELEDFNFQVEIEKMRNFIRVHGATQIGPLIQHSKIRKDFNEDVKIYLEFIMQCDRNICNVKNQYIHKL